MSKQPTYKLLPESQIHKLDNNLLHVLQDCSCTRKISYNDELFSSERQWYHHFPL